MEIISEWGGTPTSEVLLNCKRRLRVWGHCLDGITIGAEFEFRWIRVAVRNEIRHDEEEAGWSQHAMLTTWSRLQIKWTNENDKDSWDNQMACDCITMQYMSCELFRHGRSQTRNASYSKHPFAMISYQKWAELGWPRSFKPWFEILWDWWNTQEFGRIE